MHSSFYQRLIFVLLSGVLSLGCDDGTQAEDMGAEEDVRQITQAVGEACVVDADCPGFCAGATCVGSICTDDGTAANPATGAACSDSNACTTGETCSAANRCNGGTPVTCTADANACTDEVCNDPLVGCESVNNTAPCDDGNACTGGTTTNDTCAGGACTAGAPKCVDDANPCTTVACALDGTCSQVPVLDGTACNADGQACSVDECQAGACVNVSLNNSVCSDSQSCTDDVCTAGTGCSNPNRTGSCDDGNFCTVGDACSGGTCAAGAGAPNCNDGDPCTEDLCDAGAGACVNDNAHVNVVGDSCSDGIYCTGGDICVSGVGCQGTAYTASEVQDVSVCGDGNQCHTATCGAGADRATACSVGNTPDSTPCNDGQFCTGPAASYPNNDSCVGGACIEGPTNTCQETPTDNICTTNTCSESTNQCMSSNNTIACDDGNLCTTASFCAGGSCSNLTVNACNDGNPCTDSSCTPATGCNYNPVAQGTQCSDNNACTRNPAEPPGLDQCNATGNCTQTAAITCNDSNDCTSDSCSMSTGCVFTDSAAGTLCDDGLTCTGPAPNGDDACNGSGACVPGTPRNNACPQKDCAVGVCQVGTGCTFDRSTRIGDTCRGAAGVCDITEVCLASSDDCPPNDFLGNSTICSPAACSGGTQSDVVTCDDTKATCDAPNQVDCNGFACDGGTPNVCLSTCADSTDCLTTHFCNASNQCEARASIGEACDLTKPCGGSDQCVDGVCCNSPCSGQCEACNVVGSEGQCVAVNGAPHPGGSLGATRSACSSDTSVCGGTCNGTNVTSCTYPSSTTVCVNASCDTGTNSAVENSLCNGAGACITPQASDCSPYVCSGVVCRGDCTIDSHCEGDLQCNGGVCVPLFNDGEACTQNSQCSGGNCVDGVCCESTCTGQCEACNVAGTLGQCTPVSGAPVGTRAPCVGTGDCAGTCDGQRTSACTFPQTEISCGEASCSDAVATLAAYCNGAGTCPTAQTVACAEACEGVLCADGECAINSDCADGEVCRATVCVPADPNGTACQYDSDCESGLCVDGVCCNAACGGQCEACDVPGLLGTCSIVDAGEAPHGARQACASDGSACGGTCDGTNRATCGYPADVECRAGDCQAGAATVLALCDGSGSCPDLQTQDCGAVGCNANEGVCDGACATNPSACAAGEYCSAGLCIPESPNGTTCGSDAQCASGNCVDGFCCDVACDGQCAACDVPGSEGTCRATTGAPRGGRGACEGSGTCGAVCDGSDMNACSLPDDSTTCGVAICNSGVVSGTPVCNGEGRCLPSEVTSCPSLVCDGNQCADVCSDSSDCLGNLVCIDSACVPDPYINAMDKGSCGCKAVGQRAPLETPALWLGPLLVLALRRRRRHVA